MSRPYTVLLAAGDGDERAALTERLTQLGCAVELANDVETAQALLEGDQIDLLLLAVMAPDQRTNGSLRRLAAAASAREVPVLGLAAVHELEQALEASDAPIADYLIRPLHPRLVDARVDTFRRVKQLWQESLDQRGRIGQLEHKVEALLNAVIPIGVGLLATPDFEHMLETILLEAKALCHADGGTLYLRRDDDTLEFAIVRTDSLGIQLGGRGGGPITFPPLSMVDPESGAPNHRNVATHAALSGESVNIPDAYHASGFEFSGTIAFDQRTGYRSTSFLTVPLKNQSGRVIGVLQLLNATDPATGAVVPFDPGFVPLVESLSTLAAAALEVYLREERLRREIRDLHIQIDEHKRARQVAEIADTDYFRDLQQKARRLRGRDGG